MQSDNAKLILDQLFRIVAAIEDAVLIGRVPEINLQCAIKPARRDLLKGTENLTLRQKRISCFKYGSRQFAIMLAVISFICEALSCAKIMTKRDIYYRNVPLFGCQATVDDAISRLTKHLHVERHQLNIRSAAKGLARGPLQIHLQDGSVVNCDPGNYLIAETEFYQSFTLEKCDAVLVIEKEAIFQGLVSSNFHNTCNFQCLLVTGKGYPDVYTRRFLRLLEQHILASEDVVQRNTPILCLVDSDPHGFEIMTTYKYGSKAMAVNTANLAVASLKWLGVHFSDYATTCEGLLSYTNADSKKLDALLEDQHLCNLDIPATWTTELQKMRVLQRKAEIEVLAELYSDIGTFLRTKIMSKQWL